MSELLAELRNALDVAAEGDRPMRIGSDHVHLLRAALTDLDRLRETKDEQRPHEHAWQTLGYHTVESEVRIIQSCGCGEARQKVAEVVR